MAGPLYVLGLFKGRCWRLTPAPPRSVRDLAASPETLARLRARRATGPSGRFGLPGRRLLYLSSLQRTCIAECLHHWSRMVADAPGILAPGDTLTGAFTPYQVFAVLADVRAGHANLHHPATYAPTHRFALKALADPRLSGIWYRSVRDPHGECLALWDSNAATPGKQGGTFTARWNGSRLVRATKPRTKKPPAS